MEKVCKCNKAVGESNFVSKALEYNTVLLQIRAYVTFGQNKPDQFLFLQNVCFAGKPIFQILSCRWQIGSKFIWSKFLRRAFQHLLVEQRSICPQIAPLFLPIFFTLLSQSVHFYLCLLSCGLSSGALFG